MPQHAESGTQGSEEQQQELLQQKTVQHGDAKLCCHDCQKRGHKACQGSCKKSLCTAYALVLLSCGKHVLVTVLTSAPQRIYTTFLAAASLFGHRPHKLMIAFYVCRCAKKWRDRFAKSPCVSAEKLARFDQGVCPACLAICACKKCMNKRSLKVGGGRPCFSEAQQRDFAVHTLAVLKPHLDIFRSVRAEEVHMPDIPQQDMIDKAQSDFLHAQLAAHVAKALLMCQMLAYVPCVLKAAGLHCCIAGHNHQHAYPRLLERHLSHRCSSNLLN